MVSPLLFKFSLEMKNSKSMMLTSVFILHQSINICGDILKELYTVETDSIHCLYLFLRNHIFQPKTKNITGQLSCQAFRLSLGEHSWRRSFASIKSSFLNISVSKWYDWNGVPFAVKTEEKLKNKVLMHSICTSRSMKCHLLKLILDFLILISRILKKCKCNFSLRFYVLINIYLYTFSCIHA